MKTPPSNGRAIPTVYPVAVVALLLIGGTRLAVESSCSRTGWRRAFHRLFTAISTTNTANTEEDFVDVLQNKCNVFQGEWILDEPSSRPLYTEESCPYLTRQVTCQRNGRPDSLYQSWKWKPNACVLPRFDAVRLLKSLRNKRLMFIGDSIHRTQWESMVCLLQSAIPDDTKKSMHKIPPRKIFTAKEFNASIEFYWAPFLVESNSDHATKHSVQKRLVKLESIEKHSRHWKGADVLVFESYVWWMYKPLINATTESIGIKEYDVSTAYRMALHTWANWIESTINPRTQKVFFTSLSPTHLWSWEWRAGSNGNCFNESYPIRGSYWGVGSNMDIMRAVTDVLQDLKKISVTLLNITQLSEYRKDGHTSVYTERRGELLTNEQRAQPDIYADCIHWCLPGVPDTWNEILYAYLMHNHETT